MIRRSFSARFAVTATGWVVPYETANGSITRSAALRPTTETGSSGSWVDFATRERERDVLRELGLDQLLVVGEVEAADTVVRVPLVVGDRSETVWQVVISGVNPRVPYLTVA